MEKSPLKKLEEQKNKKVYSANDLEEVKKVLNDLNKSYKKNSKLKHVFLRGVINGMGTVIGATIIASIVLGVLAKTIDKIDNIPIIQDYIDSQKIKDATHLDSFTTE